MRYPLENLGDERFQQLCQALLAKTFPEIQCYPVSQADGGRDALLVDSQGNGFTVYQVKYATGQTSYKNIVSWLKRVLANEEAKIDKLVENGANNYILLTNLPGTGKLDQGSIDCVAKLLKDELPIPGQCWWRDDIERRLDNAWDIKWSFPEVLNNYDIIRMVLQAQDSASADRRSRALKSALRDQYDSEKDVRFKQLDLRNDLLDLFVDVPIRVPESDEQPFQKDSRITLLREIKQRVSYEFDQGEETIGAANLLLDELCQTHLNRVILEGAPGQGKSTIVQYVCQIHRQHLLSDGLDDQRVLKEHRLQPVRIPIKVDCRDLDAWLKGENPYSDVNEVVAFSSRSIETLFCSHIQHHSGGSSFDVADLHALIHSSAMLFVFDGLDEVADVDSRNNVVIEITKGIARLEELSLSVQTIVTSRPTAFANSSSFPQDKYLYIHLSSIGRGIIEEYTTRWLHVRELEEREANEIRSILSEKLDQPHMAELARNPMQLSILLNLIHTRGSSLPDKRTALYDSYVDLFFAREADKNTVVRDHRDLLINIHQYLAWILHSEAQTKGNRGSISQSRLRKLLNGYLSAEGHTTDLVEVLFSGITERVVALVSRVEGTYEFEVQPLREYFAAKYLYVTIPYSPAGNERTGTLPERFDALSRDFFWQNVTRFYAGCYSRGELPSLALSLKELSQSEGYSMTAHAQNLAARILSDWTFAQYPKVMKEVVSLVVDDAALRYLSCENIRYFRPTTLALPPQSGQEELIHRCFELLLDGVPTDYSRVLLEVLRENSSSPETLIGWKKGAKQIKGSKLTDWIGYGRFIGVLDQVDHDDLVRDGKGENGQRLAYLYAGGSLRGKLTKKELDDIISWLLSPVDIWTLYVSGDDTLGTLGRLLSPTALALGISGQEDKTLTTLWREHLTRYTGAINRKETNLPSSPLAEQCCRFVTIGETLADEYTVAQWHRDLEPWSKLVEAGRAEFGEVWVFYALAIVASALIISPEVYQRPEDLFDDSVELCQRACSVRGREGEWTWWKRQLQAAVEPAKKTFVLALFFSWSGPKTLIRVSRFADNVLQTLPEEWWIRLHSASSNASFRPSLRLRKIDLDISALPTDLSPRFIVLLAEQLNKQTIDALCTTKLANYDGLDPVVSRLLLDSAIRCAVKEKDKWQEFLPVIKTCHENGATLDYYITTNFGELAEDRQEVMDPTTAEYIVRNYTSYPLTLVSIAEQIYRSEVARKVEPVGDVARKECWFDSTIENLSIEP